MRRLARRAAALATAATLLALGAATSALAADSVYWFDIEQPDPLISRTNLSGGGGTDILRANPSVGAFLGIAIDAAAGRIYWIEGDRINFSNLDGSGRQQLNPAGVRIESPAWLAIDTTAGKLYWFDEKTEDEQEGSDDTEPAIAYANLDGSGGGHLRATGATIEFPSGLVVHPAGGKLYWTDSNRSKIGYANLDGSGGGELDTGSAQIDEPFGLAVDAATQRVYWSNSESGTIGFASLSGGGGGSFQPNGTGIGFPAGIAIDPAADRLYWSRGGPSPIGFASLANGSGGGSLDIAGASAPLLAAANPILLKAPARARTGAVASPVTVLPAYKPGAHFTCGIAWAGDLVEANLMQAPQAVAYRWLRNGIPVPGATTTMLSPIEVGQYSCQSTATNFAGSTTLSGASFTVVSKLKLGKLKLNRKKGTATLSLSVEGPGRVKLAGKGMAPAKRIARAARTLKLTIRAKGKTKRKLFATGSARITAKLAFTPSGGKAQMQRRPIVLKRR
ncbi:MAG TPA: hypothetical protein VFX45_00210 [Solirubrobacterales bacterium]|nr:hypothetical protein [Solirubrobacterales bacterium]